MHLFEPTTIGSLEVKNHFIRSATYEGGATEEGYPTEAIYDTYVKLAQGQIGTIITSFTRIAKKDQSQPKQLSLYSDDMVSAYREMARRVHSLGSKIIVQLAHGSSAKQVQRDPRIFGPSSVTNPRSGLTSKAMSKEDLATVKEEFAQAARRAQEAGLDGVQIHCAHGYLLSQFISPLFNKRNDEYGGSAENRIRYIVEIYRRIREVTGPEFPIWIKINCTDNKEGGLTTEDFLAMGKILADEGIDAIEVSGNSWRSAPATARNYYKDQAMALSQVIDTPVILTGGVRHLDDMEDIMAKSKVQLFGMSRPLLKAPDYLLSLK